MVITRFAPSPTGMLHIGSARTALFNYLFAKKHNGKFLLRIEDTDKARSTKEAVDAIFEGLNWLGLQSDNDAIFQSENIAQHQKDVQTLIKNGHAYYSYDDMDKIAQEKEECKQHKKPYKYNPIWRNFTGEPPKNIQPAVRLKVPTGKIIFEDKVRGKIEFDCNDIEDFVLLRNDQTPTYMMAVVSDDIAMNVSHVIRGDDHIANTPKQILIYQALKKNIPVFAHLPLIHDISGNKLSKRKNAASTQEYREMGYLNEAVLNYLLKLGWSYQDREFFTLQEAIELFSLEGVGKSPSRFDFQKLDFINLHYIQNKTNDDVFNLIKPNLIKILKREIKDVEKERLILILDDLKKAKNINELSENASLFCDIEIKVPDSILENIKEDSFILKGLISLVEQSELSDIDEKIKLFLEKEKISFSKFGSAIRLALIGKKSGPSIANMLKAFGKETTIKRLKSFL
jgi:glutamyl-tRNA synthetase